MRPNDQPEDDMTETKQLSASDCKDDRAALAAARALLQAGESEAAARVLDEAFRRWPESGRIALQRAELARRSRDLRGALEVYRAMLAQSLDPKLQALVCARLATVSLQVGDYRQAEEAANLLLARAPGHVVGFRTLATVALARGDFDAALQNARRVAESQPERSDNLVFLTQFLVLTGRVAEAAAAVEAGLSRHPDDDALQRKMVEFRLRRGEIQQGRDIARALWDRDPDHPANALFMSRAEAATGDADAATAVLETALRRHPDHLGLLCQYSDRLRVNGDLARAIEVAERAVALDPANAAGPLQLARCHGHQGRADLEEQAIRSVLSLNPTATVALRRLAELQLRQGRRDEAMALARRAEEIDPSDSRTHELLSRLYLAAGQNDEARQAGRRATELAPVLPDHFRRYGDILVRLGEVEAGQSWRLRAADAAVANAPHDIGPLLRRARTLLGAGRVEDAVADARRAMDLAPASGQPASLLAEIAVLQRNPTEAESWWRRAIAIEPRFAPPHLRLIRALLGRRDLAGAEAASADALRVSPADPALHRARADVLLALGRADEALQAGRAAVDLAPALPANHDTLARLHLARGEIAEARAAAERAVELPPPHPSHIKRLAAILLRQGGEEPRARSLSMQAADLALELSPNRSGPLREKAQLLIEEGALDEAEPLLLRAVEASPSETGALARLLMAVAMQRGRAGEAYGWMKKIAPLRKEDVNPLGQLGMLLAQAGDTASAIDATRRALALRPDLTRLGYQLNALESQVFA
ncbi:hypothetical protein CH337_05790 [Rhodoblastus acidophilus]|nr:hypothetical protein CKO16_04205 [Rhodoblastus acidophilus]RAI22349.1 hypothetical protein CH337_05790 [Rhodoblastus acidophilus]